ncbi:unnamed protein product, partial [Protopolystoma xenopodis]
VRVPAYPSGSCIVWEFASDDYDIGFGLFFEWAPALSSASLNPPDSSIDAAHSPQSYHATHNDSSTTTAPPLDANKISPGAALNEPIGSPSLPYAEAGSVAVTSGVQPVLVPTNLVSQPLVDEIIPNARRNCHQEVHCGSHIYPGLGTYLFKFDNTFSLWRSKRLFYRVYYTR